jgi:hypothetical protein
MNKALLYQITCDGKQIISTNILFVPATVSPHVKRLESPWME